MESEEFLNRQFLTLRDEIKAIKARMFWTVMFGLFGIPALAFLASHDQDLAFPLVPFSVLVLIVLFLAEQNEMMRAGRFIRERIESQMAGTAGWEAWLESGTDRRLMEKHFAACFLVIFFVYYVTTIGLALRRLFAADVADPSGGERYWMYGFSAAYLIGALWAISILVHHWRSAVTTLSSDDRS